MMQKLKLTVNEDEDAPLPGAGGDVRLPGLHVRPVLLAADGPAPIWATGRRRRSVSALSRRSSELTEPTRGSGRTPRSMVAQAEPDAARLGELLLSGPRQPGLPGDRSATLRYGSASGCVRKHKVRDAGAARYPRSLPVRGAWARRVCGATAQRSVGERMRPCPRAGCGKSARPVR